MNNTQLNAPLAFYKEMAGKLAQVRKQLGRPLTLTEKILFTHLFDQSKVSEFVRGKSQVALRPDRVAMQDATAQMAMLQYMQAGLGQVAVPTSIHCDHLIQAHAGAAADLKEALGANHEVYEFLRSAAFAHGIEFGAPGKGIIHQVILENLAFPGTLMVGTDSHTPNAGGLSMLAIGVGGADAVEVMAGEPWTLTWPRLIGVKLTGKPNGWTSAKDVILKLAGILGAAGGTGAIIEYFGEGTESLGVTGQATITNMGAELGATTSVFPFADATVTYLYKTGRRDLANAVLDNHDLLRADAEVCSGAEHYFDQVIEIDLDTLEPYVVGPFTPDLARPISELAAEVKAKGYPEVLSYALIGSCTNSSYEDMGRAAHIARQAAAAGLTCECDLLVTPGSTQVFHTIERDGYVKDFDAIGATVLANACGPCIGQWQRADGNNGGVNSIINSFNRPFKGRNDNNPLTHAFIASPEIVVALSLAGRLTFNPLTDELEGKDGRKFKLSPPTADALPVNGFVRDNEAIVAGQDGVEYTVSVAPQSSRLQLLEPFGAFGGEDFVELPVLVKVQGKCTTDHISPAGVEWLRFRGHLDRISDNMFSRVTNALTGEVGTGVNLLTGEKSSLSKVARQYKAAGLQWVAVGDTNYGEGSSREHAAMSPRYLGAAAVIACSFARIHRSNLFKQGVLALTFVNEADYGKIIAGDRLSLGGLSHLKPGVPVSCLVCHAAGGSDTIELDHGMSEEQIAWFQAGSFLNFVKTKRAHLTKPECSKCSSIRQKLGRVLAFLRGLWRRVFSG